MKVLFVRWCMDPKGRTQVAVEPKRVDVVDHFSPAFKAPDQEEFPAASKIIMQGKQEYVVQGDVEAVLRLLKQGEAT